MIEVSSLVKRYGDHTAVDHLSFTVEEGQITGFLGPNGAGKSTTMNIITGYLAPSEGRVVIDGHDILEEPEEAKKCIGYLPELPPLYPEMTVREYLDFAAELKKVPKEKKAEEIEKAMDEVKITDMANRLIKNLSKGYCQRVGLAQAILGNPKILILDEPTVGLDPKQIIEIRELMKNLGKKHTVLLSSHILSEVSAVCDYVMIISHGKLVASDTPENLSKLTQGSNILDLTVRGQMGTIVSAVGMMSDIEDVQYADSAENGCVDVRIKTAQDVDIRENIFYRMAELQCPILKMQYSSLSLEDVFLELTEDSEAEENSEAAEDTSEENDTEEFFEEEFPEDTPEEENIEEKEKENESNL
ncbi:MAG TPA: ABC transporter ATP-binding protein [Candidatus Scatomonas pullistercoris]|uniref:ABC transporter ATP-binding protein n=1 Tax=Candidatus Scatomonas pullistercoris TaxID=2840920 RepID=A0A9D1P3K2_9FIRM|nr:ABC transporter ATP-binding protein [Candidatus Scatomonas pullistercoris]